MLVTDNLGQILNSISTNSHLPFEWDTRVEKAFMQTLASQLLSSSNQSFQLFTEQFSAKFKTFVSICFRILTNQKHCLLTRVAGQLRS